MKKTVFSLFLLILILCIIPGRTASAADTAEEQAAAAERGRAALIATGHSSLLHFPEEEDYLTEWKTLYARSAYHAPCLEVKSVPDMYDNYYPNMPYLYEGTEVKVVAEHGDMSCILYDGFNLKHYCGWIKSVRLLKEFRGKQLSIGTAKESGFSVLSEEVPMHEENAGYCRFWRSSVAFPAVENCTGFQLEYQLIAENVDIEYYWYAVYGPRKVYVCDGEKWTEVGRFEYPGPGTVKVQVWLDHPMTVAAVGTDPVCIEPDLPLDRRTINEFYIAD